VKEDLTASQQIALFFEQWRSQNHLHVGKTQHLGHMNSHRGGKKKGTKECGISSG
jgi:hypothetical protein